MEVFEAIRTRRSIREYLPKPIEPEKLEKVAEAFRLAPSARNLQNWKLLIVTDKELKEKLKEVSPGKTPMIAQAPALLVGVGLSGDVMTNNHRVDTTDVSIALSFAMLEATALGLGTCWMGYYTEPEFLAALSLPEDNTVVAIMPIGYADEAPEARPRKPAEEVISYV